MIGINGAKFVAEVDRGYRLGGLARRVRSAHFSRPCSARPAGPASLAPVAPPPTAGRLGARGSRRTPAPLGDDGAAFASSPSSSPRYVALQMAKGSKRCARRSPRPRRASRVAQRASGRNPAGPPNMQISAGEAISGGRRTHHQDEADGDERGVQAGRRPGRARPRGGVDQPDQSAEPSHTGQGQSGQPRESGPQDQEQFVDRPVPGLGDRA
jgi:hypothetical protein